MTYLKSGLQINRYVPADWGPLDVYVEVAEDLFVNRCVYVYECGRCFRYDRTNHCDEFGSLGMAKYDAVKWEQWWGPSLTIAARDFERIWTDAAHAMNQPQNYDSSYPWFIPPFA